MLFIFFFLAAFSEAVMDTLQFHYYRSIFSSLNPIFWNPTLSWKNKYTRGDHELGPKFTGSTTIFVFMTDAWHLFKFFRNLFLFLGIFFACLYVSSLRDAVIMTVSTRVVFGVTFTGFMKILLKD